jgi:hypothetical protein
MMAYRPKIKLPRWLRHPVGAARSYWLSLLYQIFLVGVLIAIGNAYAAYHQVDLRGFFARGTPLPSWTYMGDRATAMLVEAFIAASVGATIRWITLSPVADSPFLLSSYLSGWLADFVLAPFIVTVLVIILRSPSLTFGESTLSLSSADIGTIWALAAIAGFFPLDTQKTFRRLRDKIYPDRFDLDDIDPAAVLAFREQVDGQNGVGPNREENSGTAQPQVEHEESQPNNIGEDSEL